MTVRHLSWIALLALLAAGNSVAQDKKANAAAAQDDLKGSASAAQAALGDVDGHDALRSQVKSGDSIAMVLLGMEIQQNRPPDLSGAADLFERAAAKGSDYGREQACLVNLFGYGRPANPATAMAYCNKLPSSNPVALFSAGYDYDHGIAGARDPDTALGFYAEAVKLGSPDAMDALGQKALELGKLDRALQWFRLAAAGGSPEGMYHLAVMMETGQGGVTDADEALWLYVNAARHGQGKAVAWLAARWPQGVPDNPLIDLPEVTLVGDGETRITQTIEGKTGTVVKPFDVYAMTRELVASFPPAAQSREVDGRATIQCHIDSHHVIDVCLLLNDHPAGYGFGVRIQTLFKSTLTAADTDIGGKPTSNSLTTLGFVWLLN